MIVPLSVRRRNRIGLYLANADSELAGEFTSSSPEFRNYLPTMWGASLLFSSQMLSMSSASPLRFHVTLKLHGLE